MTEQTKRPFTGVLLAGGRSSRMGQNKAELLLEGRTLLEHQADKLRKAGAEEILISGAGCRQLPGTRIIPDLLPDRGPLGGLHACLQAASFDRCLVISVDVPLVPVESLKKLLAEHTGGVTVLSHGGYDEPLMGVYDSALSAQIGEMIREGGAPVRALKRELPWKTVEYEGDKTLLCNCNTPEEFEAMRRKVTKQY